MKPVCWFWITAANLATEQYCECSCYSETQRPHACQLFKRRTIFIHVLKHKKIKNKNWLHDSWMLRPSSSAWLPWLSSGSWQTGGIMNSDVDDGCGIWAYVFSCPLHARTPWLHQRRFVLLPPPFFAQKKNKKPPKKPKNTPNRLEDIVCGGALARLHALLFYLSFTY